MTTTNLTRNIVLLSAGSFNPITNMHLRLFELARDALHKTCKYNVTGGIISPVHDKYQDLTTKRLVSGKHRVAMCRLATKSSNWIRASAWETDQAGWTRVKPLLEYFQQIISDNTHELPGVPSDSQVKFMCGADLLESFSVPGLWRDDEIETIVGKYGIVVITRTGYDPDKFVSGHSILSKYTENIDIVEEYIQNEISSTKIRLALSRGESIKYLVDDAVIDYINQHSLFQQ